MKLLVCIKAAAVVEDDFPLRDDGRGLIESDIDRALNEWDGYATEAAVRLRDAQGGEVVVVTVGSETSDGALRRCLAMGADRAIRIEPAEDSVLEDPIAVAALLADTARQEEPELILCGFQSSDGLNAATPSALAAWLALPSETCVVSFEFDPAAVKVVVRRELEGGVVEIREVETPAVLSIQTGTDQPRYATFRAIKQAELKPLQLVKGSTPAKHAEVVRLFTPLRERRAEILVGPVAAVAAQIAALVEERRS